MGKARAPVPIWLYSSCPCGNKGLRIATRGEFNWDSASPLSTVAFRPPTTPARQERDLAAFAERSGYTVIGIVKETGSM